MRKGRKKDIDARGKCIGFWLTAIIDKKTRIIIAYTMTVKKPSRYDLYRLLLEAAFVAGIPKVIVTDKYYEYKPAIKRLDRALKRHRQGAVEHIRADSWKNPPVNIPPVYNNIIESTWRVLKDGMNTGGMSIEGAMMAMKLRIIHFNFMHEHTSLVGRTPADAGLFFHRVDSFSNLIVMSRRHYKAFLMNLRHGLRRHIRFEIKPDVVRVVGDPDTPVRPLGT